MSKKARFTVNLVGNPGKGKKAGKSRKRKTRTGYKAPAGRGGR